MNVHATSQSVQGANTGWQRESGAIETGSSATDVRALVGTLLRRLPIIFGVPIIAVTLSMALYSILPSRYTASLTLLIDPKPTSKLGPDVDSSWATVDGNRINSIVSVLQSSMLMSRVVKSANLVADP